MGCRRGMNGGQGASLFYIRKIMCQAMENTNPRAAMRA